MLNKSRSRFARRHVIARDRSSKLYMALLQVAAALLLCPSDLSAQCQYDLTEMERVSCGFFAVGGSPRGMNEQGVAVGQHNTCGGAIEEAFVWVPGEDVEFLARPPAFNEAQGSDVNCHGQVAGWLGHDGLPMPGSATRTAALWDDGVPVELAMPSYANWAEAFAINDAGMIIGEARHTVSGPRHGVLWHGGTMMDLGPILRTEASSAQGLNQHGDIAGWMGTAPLIDARAFVLSDGVLTDLGVVPGGFTGRAADINERGDVAINGTVEHEGELVNRGALWSDGEMMDLGVLPGESTIGALALNNIRQVVGGGGGRAILWQYGELYDLNDLLLVPHTGTITLARDINEAGQIVARGGNTVVLTPVGRPPTDLDINCRTDSHDLILLLDDWEQTGSPADFDGDGTVGFSDLLLLLEHWG